MYGKNPDFSTSLNSLRYNIYCKKGEKASFELLPPCQNTFIQHCKRAAYQTNIWRQCFNSLIYADDPDRYGWCMNEETSDIQWMTCSSAPEEVYHFSRPFVGETNSLKLYLLILYFNVNA